MLARTADVRYRPEFLLLAAYDFEVSVGRNLLGRGTITNWTFPLPP